MSLKVWFLIVFLVGGWAFTAVRLVQERQHPSFMELQASYYQGVDDQREGKVLDN